MAVTQVSDLNSLFNLIYERALFVARELNLMVNLVDTRTATGWMDRKIPIRPAITAVSVGEVEDYNNPTTFGLSSHATISPGEVIAQVVLTDRDLDTDPSGARNDAEMELGGAIATKVDVDLLSKFTSFTNEAGPGAGAAMTIAKFAVGVAVLTNAKGRQYGPLSAVWHPYHWHDLWVELGQPAATKVLLGEVANQALRDYFVADWLSVRHYVSSNIAVDGSDDAISACFNQKALMLDTRRAARLEAERDASARAWELNITAGYGYGIVRNTDGGVKYTADAATPS